MKRWQNMKKFGRLLTYPYTELILIMLKQMGSSVRRAGGLNFGMLSLFDAEAEGKFGHPPRKSIE